MSNKFFLADGIWRWLTSHRATEFQKIRETEIESNSLYKLAIKPRKSIALNEHDLDIITTYYNQFKDKISMTKETGLDYQVIESILLRKTCSEQTLDTLKQILPYLETI